MSTNVYRAEERVYFDPDDPCTTQGYYISTTSGGYSVFDEPDTWHVLETRAEELLPNCDCVRVAGFALIASDDNDYSEAAKDALAEEVLGHTSLDFDDLLACLMTGKSLAEIVEGEGE